MSFDASFVSYGNPGGATPDPAVYKRALELGRKDVAADLERVTNVTKNQAHAENRTAARRRRRESN
jgi:hypothetical protein